MDPSALERSLAAAPARPLLADARLVRRVIKRHRRLPGIGLAVPHARCYVLGRDALLSIVDAGELGAAAASLPDDVILLPRPAPDEVDGEAAPTVLRHLWRYAFHARVHLEIERRAALGLLSDARIRERIHRIGQTEFDEIRLVLREDDLLLPPRDDRETYAEFAALYLELYHFAPAQLEDVFPALADQAATVALLAEDLDAPRLLDACRPEGATPAPRASHAGEEAPEVGALDDPPPAEATGAGPEALVAVADDARRRGNLVRSALTRLRAGAEREARADVEALARRLAEALCPRGDAGEPIDEAAWARGMFVLAKHAVARRGFFRRIEARLLYDVQRACLAAERAIGKVDLASYVLSLGRRPLARLLPATREIRVARRLRDAQRKLARVSLPRADRDRLSALFEAARRRAEENIRGALRPAVAEALRGAALEPANEPERAAFGKVVEELLDHAAAHGFLGIGLLRDALSRNQLKMDDVAGPRELWRGDALLSADRRLAPALDGVYRSGEIYLRGLQRGSSLLFGTRVGRALTLYVLLPLGGGFLVPFATPLIIDELAELGRGIGHQLAHLGSLLHVLPPEPPPLHEIPGHHPHHHLDLPAMPWVIACSVLLFGLIHSAAVRAAALQLARAVGIVLATIFVHVPRWVLSRPLVRRIFASRPVVALWRFVVKPAVLVGVVLRVTPLDRALGAAALPAAGAMVVAVSLALNSRVGIVVEEVALDALTRTLRKVGRHLLPGLFHLVAGFFRAITDAIERGFYAVDEWLRFRKGQGGGALAAKGVLGLLWFTIAYVLRILVNLFIEPTVNPIKHFPTVTVAAKVMWATTPGPIHEALTPLLGAHRAWTVVGLCMAILPGMFGFLVWELKENYKLYRATRAPVLRPVSIGHHGETMGALMKPGFHSGTLPKLYAKLRRATKKGLPAAERHKEALAEVAEAVERFADREMVALLRASPRWKGGAVHAREVVLASNRVKVILGRDGGDPCEVAFEEHGGWLVGSVAKRGWAADLSAEDRVIFENAIGGLYQLAGVDLVREQVEAALAAAFGGAAPPYDISSEGIVVWPDGGYRTELVYSLGGPRLAATVRGDAPASPPPDLDRAAVLFREQPIAWSSWVAAWADAPPARVVKGAPLLAG